MRKLQYSDAASRLALAMAMSVAILAAAPLGTAARAAADVVTTLSGLKFSDARIGTGASPGAGQTCVVQYTGWLYVNGAKGKKFDSSIDRGKPLEFVIGRGQVIPAWDEGIATMKVGGRRTLIVPPDLGYGARGAGATIPPNSWLAFDVELLAIK